MYNTILFAFLSTVVLLQVKNKSNFPTFIMVPLIVSLLTKYVLGDWDRGYKWTMIDVGYWFSIISVSLFTVYIGSKISSNTSWTV
jgi:hypothetical protein